VKKITPDWLRGKIPNCEAEALFIAPDDRNIPCLARLHLPLDRDMVLETMCSGTYRQLFSMVCNARERMFPGSVEIVPRKRDVLPPVGFPVAFHITEKSAGQEWNSLGAFVLSERIGAIQHVVTDDGGLSGSAANVSTRGIGTITEANIRFSVVAMPKHCHPVPRMAARVGYQALFFGGFPPDLRGGEALYVGLHALPEGKERPTAFGCFAEQIVSPKGLDQPISQKA
jgi:hypothetical protein